MSASETAAPRLSGRAKAAVDFGPLLVFFIAYFFGKRIAPAAGAIVGQDWTIEAGEEMFLAIAVFMPAFAVAFAYSVWKERRVAPMLLVTGVILGVLGSLTLILGNKTFFYMKPTLTYFLFAGGLGGGLLAGRNVLKLLFDGAFQMPDAAWRTLTVRYAVFFAVLGVGNEIAWRWLTRECDLGAAEAICAGEATWVNLKLFGFSVISLIFTALQAPFLAKHITEGADSAPTPAEDAPAASLADAASEKPAPRNSSPAE